MSPTFKYQRFDLIRCKEMDGVRSGAEERVRILDAEAAEREARTNGVERELRLEREWRTSLQETSISNVEKISQLHQEIDQLKRVSEVRRPRSIGDPYIVAFETRALKSSRINLTGYVIARGADVATLRALRSRLRCSARA